MASVLPIDSFPGVAASAFVAGSGSLKLDGDDSKVVTADGKVYQFRKAVNVEASCEAKGDFSSLGAGTGTPHLEAEITAGGQTFMGLTTAEYSDDKETTTINCKGRITA
jgi:hypothetical protein